MFSPHYQLLILIGLISMGILYQKYLEKQSRTTFNDYGEISQYILQSQDLDKSKKPILWIHIPYEYNARHWASFGSRSSHELNQPYLYLTVKSIIKNCDETFKIVLIDDGTFEKLLPDWTISFSSLSDPIKETVRQLAMAKLIYRYGGMVVPISFLCFRDLIGLYNRGVQDDTMFVCENYDSNVTSTNRLFYPNAGMMGAKKETPQVNQFVHFLEQHLSADFTAEGKFLGGIDAWCNKQITKGKMRVISGIEVGTRTTEDSAVTVETLLGDDYIAFYGKMFGIWIPDKMILKRRHYEWFARSSPEQLLKSQFILAKYMVLALAPDSHLGVLEPMNNPPDNNNNKSWIGFWKVPLTTGTLNVFGPKPIGLGNNIRRAKSYNS